MKVITGEAHVTSIRPKVDRSMSLTLNTPELQPAEQLELLQSLNQHIKFLLEPASDEPAIESIAIEAKREGKTPSQRLRAVLYVLWETLYEGHKQDAPNFNDFYESKMEIFIDKVKEKIDNNQT